MSYVLKTQNIEKKYKHNIAAKQVNMHIKKGEIYGLIGSNGSGKTTIMKIITGNTMPTSGHFTLFESDNVTAQRAKLGCIIETPALYNTMNARQNLNMVRTLLDKEPTLDISEVLNIVGLENTGKKKVKHFSLGMKQRLGLAMALLGSPEFLLLDEPTNGLDPVGIKEFRKLLIKLNRDYGMTILISSHILGELFKLATTYGILVNGRLVAELQHKDMEKITNEGNYEEYIIGLMEGVA